MATFSPSAALFQRWKLSNLVPFSSTMKCIILPCSLINFTPQPTEMSDLLYKKITSITPLNEEDFAYFKSLFVVKKLRKRQYFLQEGDVCKYQAFVVKGLLRSYTVDEKAANIFCSLHQKDGGWRTCRAI
jgi:CRP-like cAMP-binding protein